TNVMHGLLYYLHFLVGSYGLTIILLTVMVRGLMFPISRKQALTSLRMQELSPELKKLQAKHKDDRQAMGAAQMELYRKHGVNPFGTCWFLLLQMPVFMGLYYCLQESIHFRLAEFWPTWVINLAAPDMLIPWGDRIPLLSRPEDYGGFLYLGPFFNLLPIIAVTLMIFQQKYTMPPPADQQQEMQQKMMKYMMIFFGLMFYKVAAGLCIYFIASSSWGFAERKLLPKKKHVNNDSAPDSMLQKMLRGASQSAANGTAAATNGSPATTTAVTANGADGIRAAKRKKKRNRELSPSRGGGSSAANETPASGIRGWWLDQKEKWSEWWEELLRQAAKK
ncbi:MAG: YidC/Oxa1 family membrane protein insertase, partial [Candidatus Acidiferrum sp.]